MVTPKSGKKSKKSEDGDEEDFSKVYADLVKLALKEQEKVKIWSGHVECLFFCIFSCLCGFCSLPLAHFEFGMMEKVFVCHLFPRVISSGLIWSDFLGPWRFLWCISEAGIQNDILRNKPNIHAQMHNQDHYWIIARVYGLVTNQDYYIEDKFVIKSRHRLSWYHRKDKIIYHEEIKELFVCHSISSFLPDDCCWVHRRYFRHAAGSRRKPIWHVSHEIGSHTHSSSTPPEGWCAMLWHHLSLLGENVGVTLVKDGHGGAAIIWWALCHKLINGRTELTGKVYRRQFQAQSIHRNYKLEQALQNPFSWKGDPFSEQNPLSECYSSDPLSLWQRKKSRVALFFEQRRLPPKYDIRYGLYISGSSKGWNRGWDSRCCRWSGEQESWRA